MGCGHNLAVRLRAAGEFDEALETATRTVHAFTESLGNDHPYTLCGKVTLANTLGDLRQLDRAEELARACARTLRKVLGPGHPDTVICESNLAVTLRALDRARRPHGCGRGLSRSSGASSGGPTYGRWPSRTGGASTGISNRSCPHSES